MKKMMMIGVLAAVLAGCGGEATEPSTVSETVTQTQTQTRTAEPSPAPSAEAILEAAWDVQTEEDQANMCWGWGYDQEFMLDSFFGEAGSELVTREQASAFFDQKCG